MIYPYERYLRALLLRGYDDSTIQYRLRAIRLAEATPEELSTKREELYELLPDSAIPYILPGAKYNFETFLKKAKKQLRVLGIDELVEVMKGTRNKDWEDALLLITDKVYRMATMTMFLYGDAPEDILEVLNTKYRADMAIEAVELFSKYFWDVGRMTKLEIYSYISSIDGNKIRADFLDAFHKKTARVKWRVTGENMLTLESVLSEIMNESFDKFKSSVGHDDDSTVTKTIKWAELAIKSAEKFNKIANKEAANAVEELVFSLKKISQSDIKNPDDFEGGIE